LLVPFPEMTVRGCQEAGATTGWPVTTWSRSRVPD